MDIMIQQLLGANASPQSVNADMENSIDHDIVDVSDNFLQLFTQQLSTDSPILPDTPLSPALDNGNNTREDLEAALLNPETTSLQSEIGVLAGLPLDLAKRDAQLPESDVALLKSTTLAAKQIDSGQHLPLTTNTETASSEVSQNPARIAIKPDIETPLVSQTIQEKPPVNHSNSLIRDRHQRTSVNEHFLELHKLEFKTSRMKISDVSINNTASNIDISDGQPIENMSLPKPINTLTPLTQDDHLALLKDDINLPINAQSAGKLSQGLTEKVQILINNNQHHAKLELYPRELGQIEISLQLNENQEMQLKIHAQHQQAVELLEQALPKLKSSLEHSGFSLTNTDVSQQQQQTSEGFRQSDQSTPQENPEQQIDTAVATQINSQTSYIIAESGLDIFA